MDSLAYLVEEWPEEMIGGVVVALSPAGTNHSLVSGNLYSIFLGYLKGRQCIAIPDGTTVFLTETDHFVPDMMVVCDRGKVKSKGVYGAPDLAIEVLSPSTARNDKTKKKDVYARCGVREYWIVSPGEKSVEVYRSNGKELLLHDVHTMPHNWELEDMSEEERTSRTHFTCSLFDDFDISLEDVFYGMLEA